MTEVETKYPENLNDEKKFKLKPQSWLTKAWKDPVVSKLISTLLIVLITSIYGFYKNLVNNISLFDILKNILFFKIELYIYLIILIITLIIIWFINWLINRTKVDKFDFVLNEKIGELTFMEMYNILIKHFVKTPISLTNDKIKEIDLLTCFTMYTQKFGLGVEWDDPEDQGKFLYYTVGPILISYGLLARVRNLTETDLLKKDRIVISEMGQKFYRFLNLFRMYGNEEYHEW